MYRRRCFFLITFIVLVTHAHGIVAQETAATWRFALWQAPGECAPESVWIDEIRARTGDTPELRTYLEETSLRIENRDARFAASLAHGEDARALSAANCQDLLLLTATTVASMAPTPTAPAANSTAYETPSGTAARYRFSGDNLALFVRSDTRFESRDDSNRATARGVYRLLCARLPCDVEVPGGAQLGVARTNAEIRARLDMQDDGSLSILPATEIQLVPGREHRLSFYSHQPGFGFSETTRLSFTILAALSAIGTFAIYQSGDSVRDLQVPFVALTITMSVAAITTWLLSSLLVPHAEIQPQ